VGRRKERKGWAVKKNDFFFLKIVNTSVCFKIHMKLFRADKIMKYFV
jgi:hypothetical protein